MDRIQRALDLSRLQRAPADDSGVTLAERPELFRPDPWSERKIDAPEEPDPRAVAVEAIEAIEPAGAPVPRLPIDRGGLAERRVVLGDDRGHAAGAYRMLRAQVLQRVRARGARSIGIVSAVSGEGKTLTAVNLAMSLAAEPNQGVVLVDLDLRRPSVAQTLGIQPPRGLDAWLQDRDPLAGVMYGIEGIERLQVIPTLAPVISSSEALAGARIRDLLGRLRQGDSSRLVVVDQPPALLSDDVLTLAPQLDGYILVVTEGRTHRDDVARVFELLGHERLLGTVLNSSADSEQRAY